MIASFVAPLFTENSLPYLGAILPAGFAGGHGSSAVIGSLFTKKGHVEVFSLAMMMATIGSFFSLFGGLLWIKGHKKTKSISSVHESGVFFPSLNITFLFIFIIAMSFVLKVALNKILFFDIPMLATGVISGLIIRFLIKRICPKKVEVDNFVSIITTVLVCLGIGAIKIYIIEKYIFLITALSLFSLICSILIFRCVGLRTLGKNSFEKSLFTWGWSTGGIVFGLSLVEIVKDKMNSSLLQVLAISYLLISPIEISLILTMPSLLLTGYGQYIGICLLFVALLVLVSMLKKASK